MRKQLPKAFLLLSTALSAAVGFADSARADEQAADQSGSEIVVTARRIEERLQDVPASVAVLSQRQIEDRGITSTADLAAFTPSLSVGTQFGTDNATFILRGAYQDIGTSPTVGVYFADVIAPRGGFGGTTIHAGEGAGPGSFFDLQNVQVLKGPQGTLFGRNTTGGAVILVPKKPTPDFGGYAEVGFGDYGLIESQAVVNVPITEKIRIRAGFDQEKRDGYITNISGIGPDKFGDVDFQSYRLSAVMNITDEIENYTVLTYTYSDNNGIEGAMVNCNPSFPFLGGLACAQLAAEGSKRGPYTVDSPLYGARSFLRQWQIINTTTWNVSDDFTIKNLASYAELKGIDDSGLFGDNLPLSFGGPVLGHLELTSEGNPPDAPLTDQSTFTEELQFQGHGLDHKLDWQAGFYWEGSHPLGISGSSGVNLNDCTNYQTLQCDALIPGGNVGRRYGTITWRDYAVYAQDTYAITDDFKVTTGIRATEDITAGHTQRVVYNFVGTKVQPPVCEPGMIIPGHTFSDVDPNTCTVTDRESSTAPTGLVNFQYTPSEDLLTYIQYARGYRAGGLLSTGPIGNSTFQPEQVNAYEAGAKWTFHGAVNGLVDFAAFYNDLQNAQLQATFVPTIIGAAPNAGIINAGAARTYGFELDSTVSPFQGLVVNFGYTYLNSKLLKATQVINNPIYTISGTSIAVGGPLPLTPRNKFSIAPTYQLPLDESVGKVSVGAVLTYTGSQLIFGTGPYSQLQSTTLLNLNVNWESIFGTPVDAEFFMTNATDAHYSLYNGNFGEVFGWPEQTWAPPRMFGGRLRYHFGGASAPSPAAETPEAPVPTPPPPAPVAAAPEAQRQFQVFFDFDKSDITSAAADVITAAANTVKSGHIATVNVTGHTDTVGTVKYNQALSERRAAAVKTALIADGVSADEIAATGVGKSDPLVATKDGVREPQNRRAVILLQQAQS